MSYNQQQSIIFVKDYLLPFVNSTESTRIEAFRTLYVEGDTFLTYDQNEYADPEEVKSTLKSNIDDKEKKNPDFYITLPQLHGLVTKMLTIALTDDGYSRYYPESEVTKLSIGEQFDPNDFEKQLQEIINFKNKYSIYTWRGRGKCFTRTSAAFYVNNDILNYMAARIVEILTNLFSSTPGSDGAGYQYFGVCPKCGKFFYRKRKDAEYCSERCRAAASTQRQRQKHTDK